MTKDRSLGGKLKNLSILGLAVLALLAGPALAQDQDEELMRSITGQELVEILQSQGFAASLTYDAYGDPLIVAEVGSLSFTIITYGCNGAEQPSCGRLQMAAQFHLPDGPGESDIAMMNAYNQRFLFGRAYIDPYGSATVDYTINLNQGISKDNLVDNLNIWLHVLDNFVDGLGWGVST